MFDEELEEDSLKNATTNEQIKVVEMILIAVLGVWSIDYIAVLKDAIKDMKLGDAKAQVHTCVHDILEEPGNKDDIPTEKTKEVIKKIIRKAVDDFVIKKSDGVDLKEVKDWTRKYQKEPETVTIDDEDEEEEVSGDKS